SKIILNDLTGFDGRADAILFSSDDAFQPPPDATFEERTRWNIPGVPSRPEDAGEFDLVVIGGGYGGLGSAISAARMGAKVALIQDRRVLGGNGSSEIRVWAAGAMPPGEYPFSDIVREISDRARASPTGGVEFGDSRKRKVVDLEKNITLFLGHHAYGLEMQDGKILAVKAADVEVGRLKKIRGRFFADCTGHGFVGLWSGADTAMAEKGRMGMSNQWLWEDRKKAVSFPEQPWKNHGAHAERDPNGHRNAEMVWLAYIGGTRETLQILGDVVLTGDDIRNKKQHPDGTVLSTWSIDLHIPNPLYENAIPERKFLSKAVHDRAIDKKVGYPIPYRSFYSRNVPNLFMAGRNISVDRDALGTVRVMKTVGQMGVAVGRAAALATATDSTPRGIYTDHLDAAKKLWKLPGNARFENIDDLRKFVDGDKPPL
ncbi:MAG: FAD-dependent oxidoreductase, partial [Verrucomicrobiaceae bacterium]